MQKPHHKDLTAPEIVDLRHLLTRAGYSADAAAPRPQPAATSADLLIAITHHEAHLYHLGLFTAAAGGIGQAASGDEMDTIKPYDPHHFLHHPRHKDEDRERGQKAPEDATYYGRIADAAAQAGRIVIVGHGKGTSNAADHLAAFLKTHHPDIYARVVTEITADLSAITDRQLLVLGATALRK
jgi:hypothetical protein